MKLPVLGVLPTRPGLLPADLFDHLGAQARPLKGHTWTLDTERHVIEVSRGAEVIGIIPEAATVYIAVGTPPAQPPPPPVEATKPQQQKGRR